MRAKIKHGTPGDDRIVGSNSSLISDKLFGEDGSDTLLGLAGNDKLYGGNGNDFLYGGVGNDSIFGGDGFDILYGGAGNDKLYLGGIGQDGGGGHGGSGDDIIVGGSTLNYSSFYGEKGNDTLIAGRGSNLMFGGAGKDIYIYHDGNGEDGVIFDFQPGVDKIKIDVIGNGTTNFFAINGGVQFNFTFGGQLFVQNMSLTQLDGNVIIF